MSQTKFLYKYFYTWRSGLTQAVITHLQELEIHVDR